MEDRNSKPFSFPMMMAGWGLLALVIMLSIGLGFLIAGGLFHSSRAASEGAAPQGGFPMGPLILFFVMGVFFSLAGFLSYLTVIYSNCFTFNYARPVWLKGFTMRLRLCNIFVPLLILLGIGSMATVFAGTVLALIGVPSKIALLLPFFSVLIPGQFFFAWFNIWAPIDMPLVRKRLSALGVPPERLDTGIYVGVSDPSRSSFTKGIIEDDVGMIWLDPEAIVYQGDAQKFEIRRDKFIQIERNVDKGSMAAYAGAVHVILVWLDENGAQKRTRLHTQNCYTLRGVAKSLDRLAETLKHWQANNAAQA